MHAPRNRLRSRIAHGLDRLEASFGRPRPGRRYRPLDELILTILSQNTTDLNRDRVNRFLVDLMAAKVTGQNVAPRTRDHYLDALQSFADWLVETDRATRCPFGKIRKLVTRANREAKSTFTRRPFTVDELERLIVATLARWVRYAETHPRATEATIEWYRRKGIERAMAYLFAAWTAPRHAALRKIRWSDLDLDGKHAHDPETAPE